jgi:hypothetical protein
VSGPSTINIAGDFKIGHFGQFGPATGIAAREVRVNVAGPTVRLGDTAHANLELLAPGSRIFMGRSFRGEGQFIGDSIKGDVTMNFRLADVGQDVSGPTQLCTLTQEVLGAPGGPTNPLAGLVANNPGLFPITIGTPGVLSLTIPDAARLTCFLPATNTPASICARLGGCGGDMLIDACANPPILDFNPAGNGSSGGQGAGSFAGETLAAKINVGLSDLGETPPGLATFRLPARLCTTKCPRGREVNPNNMRVQTGQVGVANGLTTVAGLIDLADQALGVPRCRAGTCLGTLTTAVFPPNPIRIVDVMNALQIVNECFRGCATVIPCD